MILTESTVLSKSGQYIINKSQTVDVKNKQVVQKSTFIVTKDLDDDVVKDITDNPDKWNIKS